MADATPSRRPRFEPGWAFGAAAASLACALTGVALLQPSQLVEIGVVLAAIALPGWVAVGAVLANNRASDAPPPARVRAMLILAAIALATLLAGSIALLLYASHSVAGIAFAVACAVAIVCVDRAS
jgi:hypothetical protein